MVLMLDFDLLKNKIYELLFEEGKTLKIHKLYNDSFIIDIDYDGLSSKIIELIKEQNA
jgi:hypothetical protein